MAWDEQPALRAGDYQQIALQLADTARAVATDLRCAANRLPADSTARTLAVYLLEETDRRLTAQPRGNAHCAQNRARLVRALYDRLDQMDDTTPTVRRADRDGRTPGRDD
ncbi:restriction endonuclease [Streptomyces sp. 3N207]|uniref:restriction endonuclease n=1 Tax=Streptomyces sp. 3N207 TaxID=3457417 RepID=UPI003FD1428D